MNLYQGQLVTFSSSTALVASWIQSEAKTQFEDKRAPTFANACATSAHQFLKSLPIGSNVNITSKKAQKKLYKNLKSHVRSSVNPESYGFIPVPIFGFLFMTIIGALISWVIQKLLDMYLGTHFRTEGLDD